MSNKIAKSPEMLQKEATVKDLRKKLKKKQSQLKSLKTRLKNTQTSIEEIQRKVQSETFRRMEEVDSLRLEIIELAKQLKKQKGMSREDKEQLQMMADQMAAEDDLFGQGFQDYKTQKEQMESGDFDFDENTRAKMHSMFQEFQVKPEEKEQRDIRKVFLKLSQKFHPDLAKSEREAKEFHAMQQQINEAYQNNDIQALLELESLYLLEAIDYSAKAITVDVLQQEIDRLQRDVEFIEQQIKRTSGEIKNLRKSELGKMLTNMNKLEREGEGFDLMHSEMDYSIEMLTALRDGFKESIELGHLSPKLMELTAGQAGLYDDELEEGNPLDLLMRMAEGDEDAFDLFNGFYEDEEVENPKFPIGSSVRVKRSSRSPYHPKTDINGWEGRVENAYYEDQEIFYEVSFDSLTIAQMPLKYLKYTIKQGLDFQTAELVENQLEASKPRDTETDATTAYRTALHQHQWDFLRDKKQAERLKNILLDHPERTDLQNWTPYLKEHLSFPFEATTRGALISDRGVKVRALEPHHTIDTEYGHVVWIKIKGENQPREFLLLDLKAASRFGGNHQVLEDYFTWAKEAVLM